MRDLARSTPHVDRTPAEPGTTIVRADVTFPVWDQHRRVIVLPAGLSGREACAAVVELVHERMGAAIASPPPGPGAGPAVVRRLRAVVDDLVPDGVTVDQATEWVLNEAIEDALVTIQVAIIRQVELDAEVVA